MFDEITKQMNLLSQSIREKSKELKGADLDKIQDLLTQFNKEKAEAEKKIEEAMNKLNDLNND